MEKDLEYRLSRAISAKDLALLKNLIEAKANVSHPWEDKILFCPLSSAVSHSWFEGVQCLLQAKADVNQSSKDNWTILQEAAFCANGPITRLLIDNGANVDAIGYNKQSAMIMASSDRCVASLREICRVAKNFKVCGTQNLIPLEAAVLNHATLATAILLDAGARTTDMVRTSVWPNWFKDLLASRKRIKSTSVALFACTRPLVGKDMAKTLITMVWDTRDFEEWK